MTILPPSNLCVNSQHPYLLFRNSVEYNSVSEEVQTTNHNCVHIILFLLHVSAFLESHHHAIKEIYEQRQFKYIYYNDTFPDS
jgi:hypothetical protein